jgi:hypothetical protein
VDSTLQNIETISKGPPTAEALVVIQARNGSSSADGRI